MEIREAGGEERSLLAVLIRDSFRDVAERFDITRENTPTHPYFCTEEWVDAAMAKGVRFFVLDENGKVCGGVALEDAGGGESYMERLAVLPECRRRGLGEALVQHVLEKARQSGARKLSIGVIAGELRLLEWYGKLGFGETGREYFDHLPFQVVFMAKGLPG